MSPPFSNYNESRFGGKAEASLGVSASDINPSIPKQSIILHFTWHNPNNGFGGAPFPYRDHHPGIWNIVR
jgi:hypothetical protein